MTRNLRSLLRCAKNLRPEDKLAVLEDLDRPDPLIEQAWANEAKRRLIAMQRGRMRCHRLTKVIGRYRS